MKPRTSHGATLAETDRQAGARDRLLDSAERLIYAAGIHATGVDAIVRHSGTARKSFYSHFGSKESLIVAALQRRDDRWMAWFERTTLASAPRPAGQLLGMFDALHEWFSSDDFHGCAFLNAAGEIKLADDQIFKVARYHKERLLAFIGTLCAALGVAAAADETALLARQLLILVDGAIEVALLTGAPGAARDAQLAAAALLEAQQRRRAARPPRRTAAT